MACNTRLRLCAPSRVKESLIPVIELRAPLDELLDAHRTFFDEDARGVRVAEAVAGDERVLQVEADFVLIAERDRDAALSVLRVRFGEFQLGGQSTRP